MTSLEYQNPNNLKLFKMILYFHFNNIKNVTLNKSF
jgi:hypothetical protein